MTSVLGTATVMLAGHQSQLLAGWQTLPLLLKHQYQSQLLACCQMLLLLSPLVREQHVGIAF